MKLRNARGGAATLAMTLTLGLALAACGGGGVDSATTGGSGAVDPNGEMVVGSVTVPTGFDPHKELHGGERPFWFLVFDRLTQMSPTGEIEPMLASEWKVAPDGKSVTFKLRDDVTFHDGSKFDAEVVKANIERAKTIKGTMVAPDLASVKSVEVISPTEVTFVLSSSNPELPAILAGPAGAVVSPEVIKGNLDISKDPGKSGSGPYLVDTFTPNEGAVFVPADERNWDKEAGRLKRLDVKFIADERALVSALRAGELDAGYVNPFRAASIKEAEQVAASGDLEMVTSPTGVLNALLLRSSRLKDAKVREAIIRAVDRKAISDDLLQGTCVSSDQVSREGFAGFIPDFKDPFPYDPEAAKALLKDAGKSNLNLTMGFIAGREQIPQVVEQQLGAVGVKTELMPLSSVEVLTAWRAGEIDTWNFQITPDLSFGLTMDQMLGTTGVDLKDPAIDKARAKALQVVDDEGRDAVNADVMKAVIDDAVVVPYCHLDAHWLVSESVTGFEDAMLPYAQYMVDLRSVARTQ